MWETFWYFVDIVAWQFRERAWEHMETVGLGMSFLNWVFYMRDAKVEAR